jgi:hypothetical protein
LRKKEGNKHPYSILHSKQDSPEPWQQTAVLQACQAGDSFIVRDVLSSEMKVLDSVPQMHALFAALLKVPPPPPILQALNSQGSDAQQQEAWNEFSFLAR